jgi:hypothetical protein
MQDARAKEMIEKSRGRVAGYLFADIYRLYLTKVTRKGRTEDELIAVICWLTGHTQDSLQQEISGSVTLLGFFATAPLLNPDASKITGVICGYRIEDIEDDFMRKVRYMDKIVDDLAKGWSLEKVFRKDR